MADKLRVVRRQFFVCSRIIIHIIQTGHEVRLLTNFGEQTSPNRLTKFVLEVRKQFCSLQTLILHNVALQLLYTGFSKIIARAVISRKWIEPLGKGHI